MNREEALEGLRARSTAVRLAAARFFEANGVVSDYEIIEHVLGSESVPWVKRSLSAALQRIQPSLVTATEPEETLDLSGLDAAQMYAKACEEVAGSIIHEFSPIVGILSVSVPLEMGDSYERSRSRKALDQLQGLLGAMRQLKRAAQAPNYSEFNLAEFVGDVINALSFDAHTISRVRQHGPQTLLVVADRDQLYIAVSNGLRNAIEATSDLPEGVVPQVVLSWGSTATEFFLIVKDNGPGFKGDLTSALKIGSTTKPVHLGFGLALAIQAMGAMGGELIVANSDDGADFELRWLRNYEDIVR